MTSNTSHGDWYIPNETIQEDAELQEAFRVWEALLSPYPQRPFDLPGASPEDD